MGRIVLAVIATFVGGIFACTMEPPGLSGIVAISIMGGFILSEIQRKNNK